ncbi:universal stress protein PHOS32-like isoform X3 [Rhodamnia argentea]|uniref:Universal stress protein PHOS32-like isoform X3 n=1 Tax=Rhodamnia argentea TaxID=178133 RepID=A0ABM3HMP1_9MYRT|nr:universal stress protein PHOS32-like isoform X3 [Rhodamnia argentea]XP_048137868.1 universal stress protein PHOS32-like isoform X3 [Rhodamnia argentea]XP_048137869.1 universal stress protein PHOS32-like isoform X3 [Rhodamnia argentea]XP_048137870.1 universal stress protein PHOS32-like isoform X3 [Rhodamnia argentea]
MISSADRGARRHDFFHRSTERSRNFHMTNPQQAHPEPDLPDPPPPSIRTQRGTPRVPLVATPTAGASRKIAIAVDLSDESAYAVRWAVRDYLRPGDAVVLLHVRPTSVLYGADWGAGSSPSADHLSGEEEEKLESDFDSLTAAKLDNLAQPLVEAGIPFKIHIVKDHDMKERLCLEVERLRLSAMIMGSRGFGAARRAGKGRLGSVSDYCVHHCICPVVVVRFPEEEGGRMGVAEEGGEDGELELHPVPEEEDLEDADASDEHKDL